MRKLMICGMLVLSLGCTRSSERGGGTERRDSFTIRGPSTTSTVEQGEVRTVNLTVDRGKDFNQTIKLTAEAPTGLASELDHNVIRPADTGDVHMKIIVAKDFPSGNKTIKVIATPDSGNPTALDINVNVKARESATRDGATTTNTTSRPDTDDKDRAFTLKGPNSTTTIRRGETQNVKVDIQRRSGFNGTVNLRTEVPKDLEATLDSTNVDSNHKGTVNLRVTVPKSAALGEHSLRVFGNTDNGPTHSWEVKVNVKD